MKSKKYGLTILLVFVNITVLLLIGMQSGLLDASTSKGRQIDQENLKIKAETQFLDDNTRQEQAILYVNQIDEGVLELSINPTASVSQIAYELEISSENLEFINFEPFEAFNIKLTQDLTPNWFSGVYGYLNITDSDMYEFDKESIILGYLEYQGDFDIVDLSLSLDSKVVINNKQYLLNTINEK